MVVESGYGPILMGIREHVNAKNEIKRIAPTIRKIPELKSLHCKVRPLKFHA